MAQSITVYEASHEVTAFSSKYDAVPAGKARSSRRKSRRDMTCFEAKRNATSVDGGPGEDPLFTDFTASNIGTPQIHSCLIMPKASRTRAAMLPTRAAPRSSS
jgi:cytochrome c peroxidase